MVVKCNDGIGLVEDKGNSFGGDASWRCTFLHVDWAALAGSRCGFTSGWLCPATVPCVSISVTYRTDIHVRPSGIWSTRSQGDTAALRCTVAPPVQADANAGETARVGQKPEA